MHTHVRGIQPVILRRTCPIHRECAGYICAALCFSGTMPHARCASHRNGAVHDMVQPPLQSPAVHPHGTASQIETRDHMRIDHKAASGIVNNLSDTRKQVSVVPMTLINTFAVVPPAPKIPQDPSTLPTATGQGASSPSVPGPPCAGILSLLLPIVSAIRKSRKPVAANVEPEDSSVE